MESEQFKKRINQFRATDEHNYIFACQAAVPLILNTDLLYQLWNNFKHYQYSFDPQVTYKIPHIAVSDLLLSNLCREVGFQLYEMQKEVRDLLLADLVLNLGEKRKNTVAAFLKDYSLLKYRFSQRQNLQVIHSLTADSFLDPSAMEQQIVQLINGTNVDRDKLKLLVLHHHLMPIGYESDLGLISRECTELKNDKELSPILIVAEDEDAPGVLSINIQLPQVLRKKVRKLHRETISPLRPGLSTALKLVQNCLNKGDENLTLEGLGLTDADFGEDQPLSTMLAKCVQLKTFSLVAGSALTRFPAAILSLVNLTALSVSGTSEEHTGISVLPEDIVRLQSLEILYLANDSFASLPDFVGNLWALTHLNLEGNKLTVLPGQLRYLLNLATLHLNRNMLTSLPIELLELPSLRSLHINENPVSVGLPDALLKKPAREILTALYPPIAPSNPKPSLREQKLAYDIGGNLIPVDAIEGVSEIPFNRTLIALLLTDKLPSKPEVVHNLGNLAEVFSHYQPAITYIIQMQGQAPVTETIKFTSLADFKPENIIAQSKTLSEQARLLAQSREMHAQLRSNKMLLTVLSDAFYRKTFLVLIQALASLLTFDSARQKTTSEDRERKLDETLQEASQTLSKFGGFNIVESTIKGTENLSPDRKARRSIFLHEADRQKDREHLHSLLMAWQEMLISGSSISEQVGKCAMTIKLTEHILRQTLTSVIAQTKNLETSYRCLSGFYDNLESTRAKNVSILNAGLTQLTGLDEIFFQEFLYDELKRNYYRLDLRSNYSLLVLPGFLGSDQDVYRWADLMHAIKVMLITDFKDVDTAPDLLEAFSAGNFAGAEPCLSHVIMTCNWLQAREKYHEYNEVSDLYVPPSAAFAGRLHSAPLGRPITGKKYGVSRISGTKFQLRKSEIELFDKASLVVMSNDFGVVSPQSMNTLYNGDNVGLRAYSFVRVFDHISKVIIDLINRRSFELFNAMLQRDLTRLIVKYLDNITGPDKLIETFKILRFERDPQQKDKLFMDVQIVPIFPKLPFLLKLDAEGSEDFWWTTLYQQISSPS